MAESNRPKKRVTCKRPHPNPLFKEWLESLYNDSLKDNLRLAKRAKEALTSIYKYPLTLKSGAECAILKGFDRGICHFLDENLSEVRQSNKRSKVEAQKNRDKENKEAGKAVNIEAGKAVNIEAEKAVNMEAEKAEHMEAEKAENMEAVKAENMGIENGQSFHSTAPQGVNIENCAGGISPQPTRSVPSTSGIRSKFIKGAKNTVIINSTVSTKLPEDLNGKHKTNFYEIKSDANSNTITINHNLTNMTNIPLDHNHPFTYSIDKDGIICMQCDLSASAKKKESEKPRRYYKPAYRSGGYAILVALVEQFKECPYRQCLTKDELIGKAQKHCDVSFTVPKPQTDYTAWIYAKRLINKGLLRIDRYPSVNEDVFLLTDLGRMVGEELLKKSTSDVTVNDIIFHGQPNDRVPSLDEEILIIPPPPTVFDEAESSNCVFIDMPSTTFEIVLLIDKHETAFMEKKQEPMSALFSKFNSFKFEFRSLKVGDFAWIARSKETGRELVLPYIVERKRMDDLASSIKDGRFHEQKFRLRKCGLEHVIYLIEKCGRKNVGLPQSTLMQATVNTSVQDKFLVHISDGLYESVRFIGMMTKRLIHKLKCAYLRGCNKYTNGKELMTFDFFNLASSKNKPLTVRETFIKMLLQLKGLSVEKALAITNKYSTPKALMKAYDSCTEKEGELLLANLKFNNYTRNVGPAVSKTIYMLFTKLEF